jgi:hypothetical protein
MGASWRNWSLLAMGLYALAAALPLWVLGFLFWGLPVYWLIILPVLFFVSYILFDRSWRVTDADVARYLDKSVPALEESAGLLLTENSGLLAKMQEAKTAEILSQSKLPHPWNRKCKKALMVLGVSILLTAALHLLPVHSNQAKNQPGEAAQRPEKKPEGISGVTVRIHPPAYTRRKTREQSRFNISAEEGSKVNWTIETASPAKHLYFVWNDSLKLALQPNADHTVWTFNHTVDRSGFYQLLADSTASELYRVDMIHDESPAIIVHQPKPNTVIDYGMQPRSTLQAAITDDYGVQDAWIMATISSGKGESVKFREEQLRFSNSFAAQSPAYELQRLIDLTSLKMGPGDELYFYVLAKDNGGHEKRSDIFLITITDTAQLMSLSGLTMGLDIKPDYFRSQRQIIIETEQLLREKDTLSAQRFKDRSNNLGIDQKLLRMRYGKFLGEENSLDGGETGGHDDGDHDGGADNNAAAIQQSYSHNHDIAEDAGFFADDIKSQLKATLAEMWNAELRLRTFKPQEALVFEYKALRLLKELQQKDRVYVAKTTVKTPPLKPEKRLTGELDKIQQPVWQAGLEIPLTESNAIKNAIGQLETMNRAGNKPVPVDAAMTTAYKQLSNAAAAAPSVYLSALEAMKRLLSDLREQRLPADKDIVQTKRALQQLVAPALPMPYRSTTPIQQPGRDYFKQLEQQKRS